MVHPALIQPLNQHDSCIIYFCTYLFIFILTLTMSRLKGACEGLHFAYTFHSWSNLVNKSHSKIHDSVSMMLIYWIFTSLMMANCNWELFTHHVYMRLCYLVYTQWEGVFGVLQSVKASIWAHCGHGECFGTFIYALIKV